MRIVFVSEGPNGESIKVSGYLQDEEILFGMNNQYAAPFEGGQSIVDTTVDLAAQALFGVSTKFSWMFNSFWNGASPPEVTFKVALVAEQDTDDVLTQVQNLLDMFSLETFGSALKPPGGVSALGGFQAIRDFLNKENSDIAVSQAARARTVSVYIGSENLKTASLKFLKLLPERVEFRGKLPLLVDGNFSIVYCSCTLKNPNIAIKGQPFMRRGGL